MGGDFSAPHARAFFERLAREHDELKQARPQPDEGYASEPDGSHAEWRRMNGFDG
jgi:hypothetical protein